MGSRSSGRAWASMRQSYAACMDGSQMQERQAQPVHGWKSNVRKTSTASQAIRITYFDGNNGRRSQCA
jgi:hypothetical protein